MQKFNRVYIILDVTNAFNLRKRILYSEADINGKLFTVERKRDIFSLNVIKSELLILLFLSRKAVGSKIEPESFREYFLIIF